MVDTVTSADGTRVAYEREGSGPAVVLVPGMFCDRQIFAGWAAELGKGLTVVTYDRRGRGDSGDTQPYAVEREVEDLAAVIDAVGGSAAVYGHSSGAGLALHAAASGLPIERLVLHDAPYGTDDATSVEQSRQLARTISAAVAEGRRGDAIVAFLRASGAPAERAEQMAKSPGMLRVAHTMPYDMAVMGNEEHGRVVPVELASKVTAPTLILVGERNPPFFRSTAEGLADAIPDARVAVLEGVGHEASAELVARAALPFLTESDASVDAAS